MCWWILNHHPGEGDKALICNVCWFLRYKYSYHGWFQATSVKLLKLGKNAYNQLAWINLSYQMFRILQPDFFFPAGILIISLFLSLPLSFVFKKLVLLRYNLYAVRFSSFKCIHVMSFYACIPHHNHDIPLPFLYTVARLIFLKLCFASILYLGIKPSLAMQCS